MAKLNRPTRKLNPEAGYVYCDCRDCFEITISKRETYSFDYCDGCEAAGCEQGAECKRPDAYGADEVCPLCLSWFRQAKCSPECTADIPVE